MPQQFTDNAIEDAGTAANASWRRNLGRTPGEALSVPRPASWWTGKPPADCPGMGPDGRMTSLAQPRLDRVSRDEAIAYFDNTWTLTEVLFAGLVGEEAFYRPPYHHLRHPLIFYYGHPAALYVNKLRLAGLLDGPLNADFEQVLETGVDEMRWDDMSKNEMLWPSVAAVQAYRREVYAIVRGILETHPDLADGHPPITAEHPLWAVFMGFEHERIHLETSTVLIRELPPALVRTPDAWPALHPSAHAASAQPPQPERDYPANTLVAVEASDVVLGKPREWPSFGWDNEYGRETRRVQAFSASRLLVSNGEFHAFVSAGGYRERRFWSEAGWGWRTFRNTKWPTFWVPEGPAGLNEFKLRTIFDVIPMPWRWPAAVNYYEAEAFCAWKREQTGQAVRLLNEGEHQRLRRDRWRGAAAEDPVMTADGRAMAAHIEVNLNLAWGSESPVDALGASEAGVYDAMGNVWQWMEDEFHPLEGFKADRYYEDFSVPCFDGEHQMMLGGSFASTGDEASIWARFHFRPHFFQHAGFRYAVSGDGDDRSRAVRLRDRASANVYEGREALDQYMGLHFGSAEDQMPYAFGPHDAIDYPARLARILLEAAAQYGAPTGSALDLGCAVGRSSFELARGYGRVVGVDFSHGFIEAAERLRDAGELAYFRKDEGRLGTPRTARIDPAIDRSRVRFMQGDACDLPADFAGFDGLLLANLLCRLPDPEACLKRLEQGLVSPGGLVLLVSPYSWLADYTAEARWLGGYEAPDGKPVSSAETLKARLGSQFELLREFEVPLVIREHARKYQYIVSHGMLWRRR